MSVISAKFAALKAATPRLRNTTAAQRIERMQSLWAATIERKEDLFKAANIERGTHDLDMAAELMMLKSEVDYICKKSVEMDEA